MASSPARKENPFKAWKEAQEDKRESESAYKEKPVPPVPPAPPTPPAIPAPGIAPDLPARPPDRAGYLCELTLNRGAWTWRYRRPDRADAAYAQYRQQVQPIRRDDGLPPGATGYDHKGRTVTYVQLAAIYRDEHNGCPPGASRTEVES